MARTDHLAPGKAFLNKNHFLCLRVMKVLIQYKRKYINIMENNETLVTLKNVN